MTNLNDDDLTALFDELDELSKGLETDDVEVAKSETSDDVLTTETEEKAEVAIEDAKEIAKKALSKKSSKASESEPKDENQSETKVEDVIKKTSSFELIDVVDTSEDTTLSERATKTEDLSENSIDVVKFNEETRLTDTNLDNCMMNQSSLMAYYTAQSSRSNAEVSRAKLKFEVLEASLYSAYRKKLTDEGEKATEKSIENLVRLDARWQSAKEAVIQAQMISDVHTGFVHSLRDRKDMMIQKGSDRREEYKGKVRILGETELSDKASELGKTYLGK